MATVTRGATSNLGNYLRVPCARGHGMKGKPLHVELWVSLPMGHWGVVVLHQGLHLCKAENQVSLFPEVTSMVLERE